jgi:hypothetical protein
MVDRPRPRPRNPAHRTAVPNGSVVGAAGKPLPLIHLPGQ